METTSNSDNTWQVYGGLIYLSPDKELVIDTESTLENVLFCFGMAGLLIATMGLITDLGGGELMRSENSRQRLLWYFGTIAFFLLVLFVRILLKDVYIIDPSSKLLLFKRTFLGTSYLKTVCRFDELQALFIQAKHRATKSDRYWQYCLKLLYRGGREIELLPYRTRNFYDGVHDDGELLAKILSLEFCAGGPEIYAVVKKGPSGARVEFTEKPTLSTLENFVLTTILLAIIATVAVSLYVSY